MDVEIAVMLFIVASTLAMTYFLLSRTVQTHPLQYPPGPAGAAMPDQNPWSQYRVWGKEYGHLIYFRDRNALIINDLEAAVDLLEKRARIYSDREEWNGRIQFHIRGRSSNFLQALLSSMTSVQRYSDTWRMRRKTFLQSFRRASASQFHSAQRKQIQKFLRRMVTEPSRNMQHVMTRIDILDDTYSLKHRIRALYLILNRMMIWSHIVEGSFDYILSPRISALLGRYPWLQYLPSWFPGCGFKKIAEQVRKGLGEAATNPFDLAVKNLVGVDLLYPTRRPNNIFHNQKTGSKTSLVAELVIQKEGRREEIEAIKAMGLVGAIAGADTTGSSFSSFLLAMVKHPGVQARGQEEIDDVIGQERLPTFEDRKFLPYVESIYREVMRMYPPAPLGVPHVSTEDDFYNGYYIPKGCIVSANIWAMNRDPSLYPDPDTFRPERFYDAPKGPFSSINDISAFGFGRRVCPGRYMAEDSVWLTIASVLATLTIGKAKNEEGNEIELSGEFTPGPFFSHPKPYRCAAVPRSPRAKALVFSAYE
ncbi:hypothetical protein D9757_006803 [Collybiopsis confluens]|uniref:Cytochrome P450 n=1 Tax=Collybiopsis confluens TaxID=2823264 RepID=A0A8H5HM35_9AGAR|nr:hypothetical protein D9757_006803 [Collybiopsis confluens]